MTAPLQAVPFFQDLRQRDPATGLLVMPTSVYVVARGTISTYAPIFTDPGASTALVNPLPIGVAPPNDPSNLLGGVDTNGNAGFFIMPSQVDVIINGTLRAPYDVGLSSVDVSGHLANTSDAHNYQAWANGQFLASALLGQPGGPAQNDVSGNIDPSQLVIP